MSVTATEALPGTGRIARGVHPDPRKAFSADAAVEALPAPPVVTLPLLQHTGAPCSATVKARDEVEAGARIADTDAFVAAPVHTPVAGVVQRATVVTLPNGRHLPAIPIKTAAGVPSPEALLAAELGGDWPTDDAPARDPADILRAIRDAGIVGQGGAAFPTHVKLKPNPAKPVDTLLVNGCECEPFLTADYRLAVEAPRAALAGALLAARACGARSIYIAVEDHQAGALQALREAAAGLPVTVAAVQTRYPMGGEKQTVRAVLGRTIPTGGLPLDVGVVVINVATAAAIARAIQRNRPLTHRIVTVTGAGVVTPKNLLVAVGTPYETLLDACRGLTADAARVIAGGPMMGFAIGDLGTPVTKGTSGIVALTHADVRRAEETACVRCGRCVDVCPLRLVPSRLALAARHRDGDLARRYHMAACMECGCCAYVCPASLPLVQLMRMGKAQLRRESEA